MIKIFRPLNLPPNLNLPILQWICSCIILLIRYLDFRPHNHKGSKHPYSPYEHMENMELHPLTPHPYSHHPYCCFVYLVYIPCTTRLHIPLAHPSCSYYYLLSPSIQFFAHLIVLHFLFHCTFYSYFSFFFTIYMLLCCVTFILFLFVLFCTVHWADLIWLNFTSDYTLPCIIYYVTNKETLNLEPNLNLPIL